MALADARTAPRETIVRIAAALLLFALAYALANRFQLVQAVLYRLAADDWASAFEQFAVLAGQALALLLAVLLLPRRLLAIVLLLIFPSLWLNLGFTSTSGELLTPGRLAWLQGEVGQAGNAAGEFFAPLLWAGLQALLAVALLAGVRGIMGHLVRPSVLWGLTLLLLPSVVVALFALNPPAAERNLYSYYMRVLTAEPPPPRAAIEIEPLADPEIAPPRHVVWLMDESIAYASFRELIRPALDRHQPIDFGRAASLGHCSGPSNLALRSGVDVRGATPEMDLRRNPSIWGYARAAGYRTRLIDGQMRGAPQNYLLAPELALIDERLAVSGGIDTDREIAARLNTLLQQDEPSFTFVVLRGVHFQYRDHVPEGTLTGSEPRRVQYEAALAYSKRDFFDILLDGLDREQVAIAYLSDHGQDLTEGRLAHCGREPSEAEFAIPLLAFLPQGLAARYGEPGAQDRSASQLFAATLTWMGYDRSEVEARYDNDLDRATARFLWFDRNVVPLEQGAPIGLHAEDDFPGN